MTLARRPDRAAAAAGSAAEQPIPPTSEPSVHTSRGTPAVSMPFYVSPEQQMKDKADYARKGIARGRNSVVLEYDEGILFVAPNPSSALHKVSEIYDRIAFAAVGRYNEYENLRVAGVRFADTRGYQYAREDVTARGLANWYAQVLGSIFTESNKPYEVEIVVAEVGETPDGDQMYRITFDGLGRRRARFRGHGRPGGPGRRRAEGALRRACPWRPLWARRSRPCPARATGSDRRSTRSQLEVAALVRGRAHRTFRRLDRRPAGGAARRGRPGKDAEPRAAKASWRRAVTPSLAPRPAQTAAPTRPRSRPGAAQGHLGLATPWPGQAIWAQSGSAVTVGPARRAPPPTPRGPRRRCCSSTRAGSMSRTRVSRRGRARSSRTRPGRAACRS